MPVLFEADDDQPTPKPGPSDPSSDNKPPLNPKKDTSIYQEQPSSQEAQNPNNEPSHEEEEQHTADSLFPNLDQSSNIPIEHEQETQPQSVENTPQTINDPKSPQDTPIEPDSRQQQTTTDTAEKEPEQNKQKQPEQEKDSKEHMAPLETPITERPEMTTHPERVAIDLVKQNNLPLPEKTSTGMMGAFVTAPKRTFFSTQSKGEIIIFYLRQHPITQLPWVLFALLLVVIPPFLFPLLGIFFPFELPNSYKLVFALLWYLVTFAFVYIRFILWYYNINIVTNERVVDIDFLYLLAQEVSATRIRQIEDVTYQKIGVWSTLFNYGNVLIQTAGTESNIEFLRIPDPKRVTRAIIRLMGSVPTN